MEALHLESRERNWMRCSGETLCLLKSCGLNRHIRGAKDGRSFDCYGERKEEATNRSVSFFPQKVNTLAIAHRHLQPAFYRLSPETLLGTKVVWFLDQGPRAFLVA